jgi:hypothetical protein
MARGDGGGGGGAFGWTLLGILVGITATLAVQTLIGGRGASQGHDDVAAATEPAAIARPATPHIVAPPPVPAPANVAAAAAPRTAAVPQTDQEVQDDADAVGMTSRARPAEAPSPAAPAAAQN